MKTSLVYISWLMCLLAFATWCGIGYLVWELKSEVTQLEFVRAEEESLGLSEGTASKNRVTIRETAGERAYLANYLRPDLVQTIDAIEAVGPKAGERVSIAAATTDGALQPPMEGIIVVAESAGTFVAMTRVAHLLSTIPAPAFLESFELKRDGDEKAGDPWQITARIRAYSLKQ